MNKHPNRLFVRIGSNPKADLRRGFSYVMGQFGEREGRHGGLSGYGMKWGFEYALEQLDHRMGIAGPYVDRRGKIVPMFVAVYEGTDVGTGPEGEDLFSPERLVCQVSTHKAKSTSEMIVMIRSCLEQDGYRFVGEDFAQFAEL